MHVYEVRPRKDKRGVDRISDVLPFGGLWYAEAECRQQSEFHTRVQTEPIAFHSLANIEVMNPARVEIEMAFTNLS